MTVDGDSPDVELCFWIHVDLIVCLVKDRESQRMSTLLDERGYDVKPSEVENSPGEWRGSTSGKKCDGFGLYVFIRTPVRSIDKDLSWLDPCPHFSSSWSGSTMSNSIFFSKKVSPLMIFSPTAAQ